ncbi:ubiquinone biosynthesis accessory factor UbiJ [Massilia rubra]|nr:SCP2 sterol-binding domain-containing protein [Massilia rubra]
MSPPNSFSPHSALMAPAIAAINHLLAQEAWARDALAPHSGKVACIDASGIALRLLVTRGGMVEVVPAATEEGANVTIRIKLADLPLIAQNRERAFSYVKIEGDAEFANTISQLSKGLRWEAEHDLERVVGPIAANRLAGGARSLFDGVRALHGKVTENLAEYFLEEQPLLVRPSAVEEFGADVSRLRDDVERTAKRLARLEHKLAHPSAAPDALSAAGQQKTDL